MVNILLKSNPVYKINRVCGFTPHTLFLTFKNHMSKSMAYEPSADLANFEAKSLSISPGKGPIFRKGRTVSRIPRTKPTITSVSVLGLFL